MAASTKSGDNKALEAVDNDEDELPLSEDELDSYIISVPDLNETPQAPTTPMKPKKAMDLWTPPDSNSRNKGLCTREPLKNDSSPLKLGARSGEPVTPRKQVGWFGSDGRAWVEGDGTPTRIGSYGPRIGAGR